MDAHVRFSFTQMMQQYRMRGVETSPYEMSQSLQTTEDMVCGQKGEGHQRLRGHCLCFVYNECNCFFFARWFLIEGEKLHVKV